MAARLPDQRQEAAGRDVADPVVEGLIGPDEVEHDVRRSAEPEIDEILVTAKDAEVGPERLRDGKLLQADLADCDGEVGEGAQELERELAEPAGADQQHAGARLEP